VKSLEDPRQLDLFMTRRILRFGEQLTLFPKPQLTRLPSTLSRDLPGHRETRVSDPSGE